MDSFAQTQPLIVTPPPSGFGGWFKQNVAGHLLTLIVGGSVGFIGAWYTLQDKVAQDEQRITQIEGYAARSSELKIFMETVVKQNEATNNRLGNIENALMRQQQKQ